MIWVGVDVGGTFTDVVVYDSERATMRSGKSPSTPEDTALGVSRALSLLGVELRDVARFRHGATVATNAALQRAGARLGVLTTRGHRDVLIVGRGNRTRLYDIKAVREPGLVKRSQIIEVDERVSADGTVLIALDEAAVDEAAQRFEADGAEAIAVCFLHSYANTEPETRAEELLRARLPQLPICRSSEVLPEQREFERFSTTALNAYVQPRMSSYLAQLAAQLARGGLRVAPEIMTSSGGSWTFERMSRLPVNSMLSGPAGGVIGALEFAAALGIGDIITYDMGGTSTDVALLRNGRYELASEGRVGGFPNRAAQIEINTVGAGGGSIAYLDEGGFLNVGPRSAGAVPGPACYGRGGTEPTVTDANVTLGRFFSDEPLGGEIVIDNAAAEASVTRLAQTLGLAPMAAGEGILRIAVTRMTGAIKEISVMRGIDPRDFTLFAFGGAGPLHAAEIAQELGIAKVVIPPLPGAFSAYGLLVAERRCDASLTRLMSMQDANVEDVQRVVESIRTAVAEELAQEGFTPDRMRFESSVDMRFAGQAFELTTPLPDPLIRIDDLLAAFHRVYEQRYAHADQGMVEAVSFRVAGFGLGEKPQIPVTPQSGDLQQALRNTRTVHFGGKALQTPIYERDAMPDGIAVPGPAIIQEAGSATVVIPGFSAMRDASAALILTPGAVMSKILDPITLEVVTEGLISVVREMRATVFRTARSVAIWEARDFSCGLFDARGQVVAQSEDIGSHVVPLPWSVEASLEIIGDDLAPGDVIVMNDPYLGGTHLNDVTLIYPVFHDGKLVFFPAVREHWADVGGAVPGSMSGSATEIYQEGIRIPPVKLVDKGVVNHAAMEILMSNMRVRDERMGDFNSGLAACRTAERRIRELVERYGLDTLLGGVADNLDRSETRMRAQIAKLPDGEYFYEDYLETFGPAPEHRLEPLLLPLRLSVHGDTLTADFTGSAAQAPAPVNSTLAVTAASVFITLKSVFDPTQALNQGSFRPVEVIAPKGTIVNVTHPAPAGSHGEVRKRVIATMLGALAQACPELSSADIHRTSFHNLIGGIDPANGKEFVHYEWSSGGNGGFLEDDGPSAMAAIDWGDLSTVQSTEVMESRFPLSVDWSRQSMDSGGAGRTRGGLGMRRALRLTRGSARYSLLADGAVVPPFGILGGESGAPVGSYMREDGNDRPFPTPGKVGGHEMLSGDVIVLQSAGGGGYGDPLERDPQRVLDDVTEGYVSQQAARALYGVVITGERLDAHATEGLRAQQRDARHLLHIVDSEQVAYEAIGRGSKRVLRLHPDDAAAIGVVHDQMIEVLMPGGAPLRGWVRIDATLTAGSVPLDERGRAILRARAGQRVYLRPLQVPKPA